MKLFSKSLTLLFILTLTLIISSCGGEDPFRVDYSNVPDPFSIDGIPEVKTESGLAYYVVEEGNGDVVHRRSQVVLYYTGRTLDGEIFDSSYRNQSFTPATFNDLSSLIAGFREGLIGMKEGGKRVLIIPPDLAYGTSGTHSLSGDTLRFDIELEDVLY